MSNDSNQSEAAIPRFSDIIGHKRQIASLVGAWRTNELAQAFLFVGQPGLGKRAVAQGFARGLVCLSPTDEFEPCGECESCVRGTRDVHPDVIVYEPAGAQAAEREAAAVGATSIDQMRDLREKAHFAPIYGARKVFLIPRAETMSPAAANCLLKTLEEPPPFVVIVMIAPSQGRIFPTLVSRSRRVPFRPLPADELAVALSDRFGVPAQEAQTLARTHGGRPGPAISQLGDEGFSRKRKLFCDLVIEMARADPASVFLVVDKIAAAAALHASEQIDRAKAVTDDEQEAAPETKTGRRTQDRVARILRADFLVEFVEFLATWYRDVLAVSSGSPAEAVINRDFEAPIREMGSLISIRVLSRLLAAAATAKGLLSRNANSRLVLESLALQAIKAHAAGR
jgi:DNA polymerase-3 subunit delta'